MSAKLTGHYEMADLPAPVAPEARFEGAIDLTGLGTAGLLDYVAGRSPHHPKLPLAPWFPNRSWRLKKARVVIERRHGVGSNFWERFKAAAEILAPR